MFFSLIFLLFFDCFLLFSFCFFYICFNFVLHSFIQGQYILYNLFIFTKPVETLLLSELRPC